MKRSIALVSVAVTAFTLVILASVVYGLNVRAGSEPVAEPAAEPEQAAFTVAAAPVARPSIAPEAAAGLAALYLGRTDAYSVTLAMFDKEQAYEVTFSSGDVVYVSMQGVIMGSVPAQVQVAYTGNTRQERDDRADRRGDEGGGSEHEGGGDD